jgi:probable HAF family extracellular repeat protein
LLGKYLSPTNRFVRPAAAGLLLAGALVSAAGAAASYSVSILTASGGRAAYPVAITQNGGIAGTARSALMDGQGNPVHRAFHTVGGQVVELPLLDGAPSDAALNAYGLGINSGGDVVGHCEVGAQRDPHAFLYRAEQITDLNPLLGAEFSGASAVNEAGSVVGWMWVLDLDFGLQERAFFWNQNTGVLDLGPGQAMAINSSGAVVGRTWDENGNAFPFHFEDANENNTVDAGEFVRLGSLGGLNQGALGINDSGTIVGASQEAGDPNTARTHPVLWTTGTENAAPVKLGSLTNPLGESFSYGAGINNQGQIVGSSNYIGFLYENGQMRELNALIPRGHYVAEAIAINNSARIVGQAYPHAANEPSGALLAPGAPVVNVELASLTVEPGTVTLMPGVVTVRATLSLTGKPARPVTVPLTLSLNGTPITPPRPLVAKLKKQTGFLVLTLPASTPTGEYVVSATYGGVTRTATLNVLPVPPLTLTGLTATPSTVARGKKVVFGLTLSRPAEGTIQIPVTLSKDGVPLPLPLSVKMTNKAAGTLKLKVPATMPTGVYTVSASYGGETRTVDLTVTP